MVHISALMLMAVVIGPAGQPVNVATVACLPPMKSVPGGAMAMMQCVLNGTVIDVMVMQS